MLWMAYYHLPKCDTLITPPCVASAHETAAAEEMPLEDMLHKTH